MAGVFNGLIGVTLRDTPCQANSPLWKSRLVNVKEEELSAPNSQSVFAIDGITTGAE
jgi:hypothetical protein